MFNGAAADIWINSPSASEALFNCGFSGFARPTHGTWKGQIPIVKTPLASDV